MADRECSSDLDVSCRGDGDCQSERHCSVSPELLKRRDLLGGLAAGGTIGLAGCVGVFGEPAATEVPSIGIDDSFDIEFVQQEETISVDGETPLLEAGEAQGWELPYFCRTGFCGVCLAQVDGDGHDLVDMTINQYAPLDDEAIEDGYVLTCTGYAKDDFSIETGASLVDDDPDDDEDDDPAPDDPPDGLTHTVDYVNERWTIEVPEDQSLLVAGEGRGFDLPYQCREGWCGRCLGQIDGDTRELIELAVNDYDPLDDDALADGYTLTCQGYPRGDFALESGKFDEEDWPSGSPP